MSLKEIDVTGINTDDTKRIYDEFISVLFPEIKAVFDNIDGLYDFLILGKRSEGFTLVAYNLFKSYSGKLFSCYCEGEKAWDSRKDILLSSLKNALLKATGLSVKEYDELIREAKSSNNGDDLQTENTEPVSDEQEEPRDFTDDDLISEDDFDSYDASSEHLEDTGFDEQSAETNTQTDDETTIEEGVSNAADEALSEEKEEASLGTNDNSSISENDGLNDLEAMMRQSVEPEKSAKKIDYSQEVEINTDLFGEGTNDDLSQAMYDDEEIEADKKQREPLTPHNVNVILKEPDLLSSAAFKKDDDSDEYSVDNEEYDQEVEQGLPSDDFSLEQIAQPKLGGISLEKIAEHIINQDKKLSLFSARLIKLEEQMPHTGILDIGSMYKVLDRYIELYRFNKHFLTIANRFHNFGYRTEVTGMRFYVEYEGENWVVGMSDNMPSADENIAVYSYQNDPVKFEKILQKLLAKL